MSSVVLNFHGVGAVPRELDEGERACWLDTDHFEAVLDLVRHRPRIELTFDDGNESDAEVVLPALLERGLRATFFICSGRLDQPTFLSQHQVRLLQAEGMSIGSHGVGHRCWRGLPGYELEHELEISRRVLETLCGKPVDSAACPFGEYDRRVLNGLRRAGYCSVYTSDKGASSERDWLRARTTITRSTPLSEVKHLVSVGPGFWEQRSIEFRGILKRLR